MKSAVETIKILDICIEEYIGYNNLISAWNDTEERPFPKSGKKLYSNKKDANKCMKYYINQFPTGNHPRVFYFDMYKDDYLLKNLN